MNGLVLINGKGKEYDLMSYAKSPTFIASGLGYVDETEFMQIGHDFFPLEEAIEQAEIELHLLFWENADANYKTFVNHATCNPLKLRYANDSGEYFIPCRLKSVEKVDRRFYDKYGCPVSFAVTGHPYRIIYGYNSGVITAGKSYGSTGYTYDYTYGNDITNTLILQSDSHVKSPCIITIYGEVINPIWRHYVDDELTETGSYNGTIPDGHYLVIDSKSMPYSITEYDADGVVVADRYQQCNFSQERFMTIEEGENTYVLSHEGTNAVKLKAEAYIEYDSV